MWKYALPNDLGDIIAEYLKSPPSCLKLPHILTVAILKILRDEEYTTCQNDQQIAYWWDDLIKQQAMLLPDHLQ